MNPEEFREIGHRVVDLLAEYLEHIEEKPVFPNVEPSKLTERFAEGLPQDPSSADKVLGELEEKLLPYCTHVGHPGYMGLITPSPNPVGIIADFICSALNQNPGAYTIGPAAVAMERRTVRWLSDLVGYNDKAGGNLTSGGMMANFIGLKLARDCVSNDRIQQDGIQERWTVYASEERHVSIDKAVDAVGLGRTALHSTFSKNRHGRFQESKLFEELFEQIVRQCVEVGLVQGKHLSVDGSFVEANAAKESRIPREQLAEAAEVNQTVRQYLVELEQQNPTEEPVHEQDQVSTTDPDSTYATKGGMPARLGYYDNYLVDNHSCVIVGVQATAARMSQETVAAQDMLSRFARWLGREPASVAADTTYGNGEFLQWLADRSITPYMRTRDSIHRKRSPFYGPERFTYQPERNRYICPAGQPPNYGGRVHRNRAYNYIGTRKRCGPCSQRPQCTSAAFRSLIIHQNEPARQCARELVNTPEFVKAQRERKKVEALFAELKNQIGLRRLRLRRLKFVREQFFLAAAAQNLKRLVRFLSQPTTPTVEAAS